MKIEKFTVSEFERIGAPEYRQGGLTVGLTLKQIIFLRHYWYETVQILETPEGKKLAAMAVVRLAEIDAAAAQSALDVAKAAVGGEG